MKATALSCWLCYTRMLREQLERPGEQTVVRPNRDGLAGFARLHAQPPWCLPTMGDESTLAPSGRYKRIRF